MNNGKPKTTGRPIFDFRAVEYSEPLGLLEQTAIEVDWLVVLTLYLLYHVCELALKAAGQFELRSWIASFAFHTVSAPDADRTFNLKVRVRTMRVVQFIHPDPTGLCCRLRLISM